MTNTTAASPVTRKLNSRVLLALLSILLLLLGYGVAFIVLPISILSQFQKGNCDSVLSLHRTYTALYPGFLEDQSIVGPVTECGVYTQAVSNEAQGLWRESFDEYQAYLRVYPNGLHAKEAHEHSAIALMNIVKSQTGLKQYEQALSNLNLITSQYSDIGVNAEAWAYFPLVYTSWGNDMRELGEFERAELVFKDFLTWSQTNRQAEAEMDASRELARTYLEWGLAVSSRKQFEIALAKFDLAAAADPRAQPDFADKVRSGQRQAYLGWGKDLVALKEFPSAIEKFERAVALLDGHDDDAARDELVDGHIQWALHLNMAEDFKASLEQLKIAADLPATDGMKQNVETARDETYLAFSNSSGSQARQSIKDALETVCERGEAPELPIFGINKDSIRLGLYGLDAKLPETLAAKTPGEMHYIACGELQKRVVDQETRHETFRLSTGPYVWIPFLMQRIQLSWQISLRDVVTGKEVKTTVLQGGAPPPFPSQIANYGNGRYEGAPPDVNLLWKWLESALKPDS